MDYPEDVYKVEPPLLKGLDKIDEMDKTKSLNDKIRKKISMRVVDECYSAWLYWCHFN